MSLPDPTGRDPNGNKEAPINTVALGKITVLGYTMEANIFAAICYMPLFPANIIPCVIALNTPADNASFIRFNAVQSLIINAAYAVTAFVMGGVMGIVLVIPVIGPLLNGFLGLVLFLASLLYVGLSLRLVLSSFRGKSWELPVIAKYAKEFSKS